MIHVKTILEVDAKCEGCPTRTVVKSITIGAAVDEMKKDGWYFQYNTIPISQKSVTNVLCPKCYKKLSEEMRESGDLRKQLMAGVVFDHPHFKKAALEYVGLTNHPKADQIYQHAYDNHHSEGMLSVLGELEELASMFRDVIPGSCPVCRPGR